MSTRTNSPRSSRASMLSPTRAPAAAGAQEALYDLNSARFEPRQYTRSLLRDQPLASLLQQTNRLHQEIKQLDGEMKTLVYENYSKFISATETIGQMKTDVVDMDTEMLKLKDKIQSVSAQATVLHASVQPSSAQVRRLGAVHQLLCKLQVLFDLPQTLRTCWETQDWARAVAYHRQTQPLFDHYRSLGVFISIEQECSNIMHRVKGALWDEVQSPMPGHPQAYAAAPNSPDIPAHLLPHLMASGSQELPPLAQGRKPSTSPRLAAQTHVNRIHRVARAAELLVQLDESEAARMWSSVLGIFSHEIHALLHCLVTDVDAHQLNDWAFLVQRLSTVEPTFDIDATQTAILTGPLASLTPHDDAQLYTSSPQPQPQPVEADSVATSVVGTSASASPALSDPSSLASAEPGVADVVLDKLFRASNLNHVFVVSLAEVIDSFSRCFLPSVTDTMDRSLTGVSRTSVLASDDKEQALVSLTQMVTQVVDKYTSFLTQLVRLPTFATLNHALPPIGAVAHFNHATVRAQRHIVPFLYHSRLLQIVDQEIHGLDALCTFARLNTIVDRLVTKYLASWVDMIFAVQTQELTSVLYSAMAAALPASEEEGHRTTELLTTDSESYVCPTDILAVFAYHNPHIESPLTLPSATGLPHTVPESSGSQPFFLANFAQVILQQPWSTNDLASLSRSASSESNGVPPRRSTTLLPLTDANLVALFTELRAWILRQLETEACPTLHKLLNVDLQYPSHPQGRRTLLKQLERGLGQFLEQLPVALSDLAITPGLHVNYPLVLLVMSRLCKEFDTILVPEVYRLFSFAFLPSTNLQLDDQRGLQIDMTSSVAGSPASGVACSSFNYDPKRLSLAWNHGMQKLLNRFIFVVTRAIMRAVRDAQQQYEGEQLSSVSPQQVSPVWLQIGLVWLPYMADQVQLVLSPHPTSTGGSERSKPHARPHPTGRNDTGDPSDRLQSLSGPRHSHYPSLGSRSRQVPGQIDMGASGFPPRLPSLTTDASHSLTNARFSSLTLNPLHRSYSNESHRHDSIQSNTYTRSRHPSLTTFTHHKLSSGSNGARGPGPLSATSPFSPDYPPVYSPSHISRSASHHDPAAASPSNPAALSLSSRTYSNLDPLHRHLISHIDKLFSDRLEVFGSEVPLDAAEIMTRVYRAVLKEIMERSRAQPSSFGRGVVRQTQLDVQFLKCVWQPAMDQDWVLATLADEWLASTVFRSIDPVLFDEPTLMSLVHDSLDQTKASSLHSPSD
ncbi:hypothetical protein H4R34_001226 [Dimargaris verticillata]|uniref:Vacuolar protein sorting-associated protein 51 homolog n=1 Tax=Dimargaris verticillata TaxID=2761393 RepID=A0A9W8BB73_9FUNG|nr:hypothetical protein H4R34_001226 [Dimargaris verticillata]